MKRFMFLVFSTQATFRGNKIFVVFCLWPLSPPVHSHTDFLQSHWARYNWSKWFFRAATRRIKDVSTGFPILPIVKSTLLPELSCSCLFVCLLVALFCCVFILAGWKCCCRIRFYYSTAFDFEAVLDTGIHISLSQLFATTGRL